MKKEYTITIGEIFTKQKAKELKEWLELKDREIINLERKVKGLKQKLESVYNEITANDR